MPKTSKTRPDQAFVVTREVARKEHYTTLLEGFEPPLPKDIYWGKEISSNVQIRSDKEIQSILSGSELVLTTRDGAGDNVADTLGDAGRLLFSSRMKDLFNDVEPGVHRFFEAKVVSDGPIGGITDHGTFFWLRPPPIIDCLLFPPSQTHADYKGERWSKVAEYTSVGIPLKWGG